jgi:8-oxo-dGTP pyrophosphatase MutT (NUDIX family)
VFIPLADEDVTKHLPGQHNQLDHAGVPKGLHSIFRGLMLDTSGKWKDNPTDDQVLKWIRTNKTRGLGTGDWWSRKPSTAEDFAVGESDKSSVWAFTQKVPHPVFGVVLEAHVDTEPKDNKDPLVYPGEDAVIAPHSTNTHALYAHLYRMEPGEEPRKRTFLRTIRVPGSKWGGRVTKHLPGEHDQLDHAGGRAAAMRAFLADVIGPFFYPKKGGKHRKPPAINWYNVFDDQYDSKQSSKFKDWRKPVEINDKGAYFIPMSTDPDSGDGYFFTSSGKRLWGRYGAAGTMVRSRNDKDAPVYLMAKRSSSITGGGGTWALPGGAIDKGESPVEGALREMGEEIGPPPAHSKYKVVAKDVNEVEDGWKYTTVLAEVQNPFDGEAQDWETEKGGIGWFTEGEIRNMNLHPALADRLDLIFDLWHDKKGGAHKAPRDDLTKHLPGLHNQKSHGNQAKAPWTLDGGGFLNEVEWGFHKWAYAYNIDGYKTKYDTWHQETYGEPYLPWGAPDDTIKQPVGAPDPDPPEPTLPSPDIDSFVDNVMGGEGKSVTDKVPDTVTVQAAGDMPEGLTITDHRKDKDKVPLSIDGSKMMDIWFVMDKIPEQAKVELRLLTPKHGDPYGSCQKVGPDEFIVRAYILPVDKIQSPLKDGSYPDDALYVINNSLVHEMKHVAQHYEHPNMSADYVAEGQKNGYDGNFYEKEAWLWGHYADHTGTKSDTTEYQGETLTLPSLEGDYGTKFPGHAAWAITPPGWEPDSMPTREVGRGEGTDGRGASPAAGGQVAGPESHARGSGVHQGLDAVPLGEEVQAPGASRAVYKVDAKAHAQDFHDAIVASKKKGKYGAAVTAYDASEYAEMDLYLAEGGKSGFALKDGELVSMFNNDPTFKSALDTLMPTAIAQGANRLDCFDTVLPGMYAKFGFRPVARIPFDDEYAPPGWDKTTFAKWNNGSPDVYFMAYWPGTTPPSKPPPLAKDYDDGQAIAAAAAKEAQK